MRKITLRNLEDGEDVVLWIWFVKEDMLGKGTYSKVFHAELERIGKIKFEKCVAFKMTVKDMQSSDWQKHIKEWKIQRAFDQVKQRSHVIKLFAYGYYKKYVFSVLELAQRNLTKHMRKRRIEWFKGKTKPSDRKIEPDIRQLVETVRDMHQKIMHLDLKPANLVFVHENKQLLMKAIDFGASQFIDEEEEQRNGTNQQPNACKWFVTNDPLTTEWYQSPEHYNQCNWDYKAEKEHSMKLSSKSDIWAIGIICIEMAAIGSQFKWLYDEDPEKDAEEIMGKVYGVIGKLWLVYVQNQNDIEEQMEKNWDDFYANFYILLSVRSQFPRLFHIITAVLVHEPERRPTANGILDFLDGKCRFASMVPNASRLLPWLTMDQFKLHVEKKKSILVRNERNESQSSPKKMLQEQIEEAKTLLKLADAKEWVPEERKGPCDTGTTPRPTDAQWKDEITKIDKTIGLSLSPRIQYEYDETITQEHKGLLENFS